MGGEGGEPKNKQPIKRQKKNWRKRRKKHPANNVAAESAPHPRHAAKACDNNTQTISGPETFNQQPCSPGSCHSVRLAKALRFVKRQFWQKRSLQQSHFRGRKQISFLDSQRGPPSCVESLLLRQNPTLIHLRPAKSFVSWAAQGSNCQKWDCQALPLFTWDKAIPRLF